MTIKNRQSRDTGNINRKREEKQNKNIVQYVLDKVKTDATCGAGIAYHSGAPEFTPWF